MAGLEPYNSEDDVSRSQVARRRVLLLLGPLVTPYIARWWWIEFGALATGESLLDTGYWLRYRRTSSCVAAP